MHTPFKRIIIISVFTGFAFGGTLLSLVLYSGHKKKNTGRAESLYVEAVQKYQQKQFGQALQLTKSAEKIDSQFYQAYLLEAKIHFFSSEYKEAQEILSRIRKKFPSFTDARIWNIRVLLILEQYREAEQLLTQELSFNATDWRVFYLYSLLAKKTESFDKQLVMLGYAETALTDAAKVYNDAASTWSALGVQERADTYFKMAKVIGGAK